MASDPVHEEAQGLLMRLLVQAGRHLALRQYRALRADVQWELHVEPAASLRALYQDILDGRAAQGSCSTPSEW